MTNGRGRTVLETCYGFFFQLNCCVLSVSACEKAGFPRYLGVGLRMAVFPADGRPMGHLQLRNLKNVLKGIARVDDSFGARWSA